MGAFCCHGNQSFDPICPKTLCNLSPTLMMLHIKFDQHWPTGLRDIQVSSEWWQNDRIPEGQGKSSIAPLFQSGAIKNIIYVKANVMNMYAKFQLHPPYSFWGEDLIFFQIYPLCCHGNQSNSAIWTKFIWIAEDYSRNISVKLLSKYLQWDSSECQFSFFFNY